MSTFKHEDYTLQTYSLNMLINIVYSTYQKLDLLPAVPLTCDFSSFMRCNYCMHLTNSKPPFNYKQQPTNRKCTVTYTGKQFTGAVCQKNAFSR